MRAQLGKAANPVYLGSGMDFRQVLDPSQDGWGLLSVHPVVFSDGPLSFDGTARLFRGTLSVLLYDLASPGNREDDGVLRVGEDRTVAFAVQSAGLGTATLRVGAPGLGADEVDFEFVLPWWFFGLGFVGALLGAWAAAYRASKDKRLGVFVVRTSWGVAGMLVYFVLGVQIFPIDRSVLPVSEVVVLAVAFLASFFAPALTGHQPGDEVPAPPATGG